MSRRRITWHLEVPERLDQLLEEYIRKDEFKTKSEFIRDAVREKLEREMTRLIKAAKQVPKA